jgi:hypothetical protein
MFGGQCLAASTWVNAAATCDEAGARLCTATELQAGVAKGSGCNFDFAAVWGANTAGCGADEHLIIGGSHKATAVQPACTANPMAVAAVRCCADIGAQWRSDEGDDGNSVDPATLEGSGGGSSTRLAAAKSNYTLGIVAASVILATCIILILHKWWHAKVRETHEMPPSPSELIRDCTAGATPTGTKRTSVTVATPRKQPVNPDDVDGGASNSVSDANDMSNMWEDPMG